MKSIKFLWLIGLIPLTGCLSNLNVSEFFRKLEAKNPEYHEIVSDHQDELEELIKEELENIGGGEIVWITYWGESRYACGNVIKKMGDEEYVEVLGEYKLEGEDISHLYSLWFIPSADELMVDVQIMDY